MRLLGVATLALLAGCQVIDTGVIDFRRAQALTSEQKTALRLSYLTACQFQPADAEKTQSCDPMLPSRLFDKFATTPSTYIKTNDVYSIRLDFGLIAEMAEWPKLSARGVHTNGEIAVLVNAFEVSDKPGGPRFYDFQQVDNASTENLRDLGEFANAKVVYFNPDVDEGQQLNLSNIPVVGPIRYEGRPIGLQIIVIELDRMTAATRSLLQKLADLGKMSAGPVNPATDALFELGKSMINGAQDDIIFEYRMLMDNGSHLQAQSVSAFQSGRLVFRRASDRQSTLVWRNMVLDENTGGLYKAGGGSTQQTSESVLKPQAADASEQRPLYRPYSEETYFTFNIINHGPDGPVGVYEHKRWGEVSQAFDDFLATTQSATAEAATKQINDLIVQRKSLDASNIIGKKIEDVLGRWQSFGLTLVKPLDGRNIYDVVGSFPDAPDKPELINSCVASYKAMLDDASTARLHRGNAVAATIELLELMRTNRPTGKSEADMPLQLKELSLAASRLWREAVGKFQIPVGKADEDSPSQVRNEAKFRDGATFTTEFLADDKKDALRLLLEQTASGLQANDCATIMSRRPT